MPIFFLAEIQSVSDATMYSEYIEKAAPIIKKMVENISLDQVN